MPDRENETLDLVRNAGDALVTIDGVGEDVRFIADGIAALARIALGEAPASSFDDRRDALTARLQSLSDGLECPDDVEGAPV